MENAQGSYGQLGPALASARTAQQQKNPNQGQPSNAVPDGLQPSFIQPVISELEESLGALSDSVSELFSRIDPILLPPPAPPDPERINISKPPHPESQVGARLLDLKDKVDTLTSTVKLCRFRVGL